MNCIILDQRFPYQIILTYVTFCQNYMRNRIGLLSITQKDSEEEGSLRDISFLTIYQYLLIVLAECRTFHCTVV